MDIITLGEALIDFFALKSGVSLSEVRTGLAFIALPTSNTREFLFYRNPSADMMLNWKEFDKAFIKDTKVFHFGSITLIGEPSRSSTYIAVKVAKSGGAIISYDPNLRLNLWSSANEAKRRMAETIPLANVIKVNDEELSFITGEKDIKKGIQRLISMGPKLCIVTMGAGDCFYSADRCTDFLSAFKVKTVDATGCGDSFVAGLLVGLVESEFRKLISNQ